MMASRERRVVPLQAPSLRVAFARAVRLRCPACGTTPLFVGPFAMRAACEVCGLRFEREPGYFIGAIYVNYAIAVALALGGVIVLDSVFDLSLRTQLALGLAIALGAPLAFFRHARSFWLAIEHFASQADERAELRRRR